MFFGMNIEQVRNFARQLDAKAQAIDEIISTLTSQLSNTDWKGPDSDQFRSDWNGQLTSDLRRVAQALRDASQRAQRNAQDQENTSNNSN